MILRVTNQITLFQYSRSPSFIKTLIDLVSNLRYKNKMYNDTEFLFQINKTKEYFNLLFQTNTKSKIKHALFNLKRLSIIDKYINIYEKCIITKHDN